MQDIAAWLLDTLTLGALAGVLYWLLWGGTFAQIALYGAFGGAIVAATWWLRRFRSPGRRLAKHFTTRS